MAPKDRNHIQVELQLLQDNNIELLKQFGEDWKAGNEALLVDLKNMVEQRGIGAQAAGGESASRSSDIPDVMAGAGFSRQAGEAPSRQWSQGMAEYQAANAVTPAPRGSASVAPAAIGAGFGAAAWEDAYAEDRERARQQSRPPARGLRRPISWAGRNLNEMFPEDSRDMLGSWAGAYFGGENSMMGMVAGGMVGSMLGKSKMGGLRGIASKAGILGVGYLGAQAMQNFTPGGIPDVMNMQYADQPYGGSLSMEGIHPILGAIGSDAWKHQMQQQIRTSRTGRWTLGELPHGIGGAIEGIPFVGGMLGAIGINDPKYNSKQSREALELTRAYGWGLDPDDDYGMAMQGTMMEYMKNTQKQYGSAIPQETVMKLMEPVRYGTGTFEGAEGAIAGMAEAARAAHMELGVFQEKAMAAGEALSQETGTPFQSAVQDVAAFTAATGRPPEDFQGFTSDRATYLDMARNGTGWYDAFFGKYANANRLRGTLQNLPGGMGNPSYWKGLQKRDPEQYRVARDNLTKLWKADPTFLGGMNVPDFLSLMNQGGDPAGRMRGFKHIEAAQVKADMPMGLTMAGVDEDIVDTYRDVVAGDFFGEDGLRDKAGKELEGLKGKHGKMYNYIKKHGLFKPGDSDKQQKKDARDLGLFLAGKKKDKEKAAQKTQRVVLGIHKPYDKIFYQMIKQQEEGSGHKNSAKSFARVAKGATLDGGYSLRNLDDNLGEIAGQAKDAAGDIWDALGG